LGETGYCSALSQVLMQINPEDAKKKDKEVNLFNPYV
jgi:hypothetical protein